MKKPPLLIGNWKMYKTIEEALSYFNHFEPLVRGSSAAIYLAAPFTAIKTLSDAAQNSSIAIGAQDMHEAEEGAFTGEISARMLKEAGARFVLLGHSERRCLFHEEDIVINRKVKRALKDGLQPVLCVGETQKERDSGQTEAVLREQIHEGLKGVDSRIILAYEPVWAIGTQQSATPAMVRDTHAICRHLLRELFGNDADRIPILYGGSVNLSNAEQLVSQLNVDGLLVGSASLSSENFAKIVHLAQNRSINSSSVTP